MSTDKEQQYFSDGISEELLNVLNKVPELRVIARTSSFAFKGQDLSVPDIARRLNVASILQGSVRKAGNRVRIAVQLVRATDGAQLWTETYDRNLDDIFQVQDEIAASVVEQLKIKLLKAPTVTPVDPRVYALVLQAQALLDQQSKDGRAQALLVFKQALSIAPNEARACNRIRFRTRAARSCRACGSSLAFSFGFAMHAEELDHLRIAMVEEQALTRIERGDGGHFFRG